MDKRYTIIPTGETHSGVHRPNGSCCASTVFPNHVAKALAAELNSLVDQRDSCRAMRKKSEARAESAEADRDALAAALGKIVEQFNYSMRTDYPDTGEENLADHYTWAPNCTDVPKITLGHMRFCRALLERIEKGGE